MKTLLEQESLNQVFERYLISLDVPKSKFDDAHERYKNVGSWLNRKESTLREHFPDIYPQGSFRLGTVIKPLNPEEQYDVDLVCNLIFDKNNISQKDLKEKVGYELKEYVKYNNIKKPLSSGKRCWTIEYNKEAQFHMDILPAIPDTDKDYFKTLIEARVDESFVKSGICITDATSDTYAQIYPVWPKSNPRGYSAWFKSRMGKIFEENAKRLVDGRQYASIENVPIYAVKTPLQKAVQILKRHRDLMFKNDSDNKPISIIITTMAGHAYNNQISLSEAIQSIIDGLDKEPYMHWNGKVYIVQNPVRPDENFADKWAKKAILRENYFKWVKKIREDFKAVNNTSSVKEAVEKLGMVLGTRPMQEVLGAFNLSETPKDFPNIKVKKDSSGPWGAICA